MKKENRYDFRKRMLEVHEKDVRDYGKKAPADAVALEDGLIIEIGATDDIVIQTAGADFVDFFAVSMGIKATLSTTGKASGANVITVALADDSVDMGEAASYKGFMIEVDDSIRVYGYDARGAAQGLFYLEDIMCMNRAPYVEKGTIRKKPMLVPRMIHSGYGMEEWPDEYLMKVAHDGRDALMVFVTGINQTRVGYLDFNDLIERAAKFGLDVYAYSFFLEGKQPEEEGAEEFYENTYGKLFEHCPGLKGLTLVGEVMEYHSKDPRVSPYLCYEAFTDLPDLRPKSGWFPCCDYPQILEMIQKVVYKHNKDADIVLWSYNWGFQPEDVRVELINNLPKGITLQATFEMFESWKVNGATIRGADYSIAVPGPGKYFTSEAIACKKAGVPFYTMSMAAGVTWDFGCLPYIPVPYQWIRRFEAMREAQEKWDLLGGMECHHHGYYPSIITKLSKHAFLSPAESMDAIFDRLIMSEYGEENLEKVKKGYHLWSEAMTYYTPTTSDLNGASRVGPAYPFCLYENTPVPHQEEAMFGNRVIGNFYRTRLNTFDKKISSENVLNLRIIPEMHSLETMRKLMDEGIAVLESIPNKNEKLLREINLGKYMAHCVQTNINAKRWHILKSKLNATFVKEDLYPILDDMEALLHEEIANAEETIPLVEVDSRLGWEPSMLYLGDKAQLEWKIRQVNYVLDVEIGKFRIDMEIDG